MGTSNPDLVRILQWPFGQLRGALGQQTQGVSPSQVEFSLIARLLISSGARDVPSLGKRIMITLYRR
jgi:hypothetical protein